MRRVYTLLGQGGLTLGTSQVRIEGLKICPRDFLDTGQGFKDKSLVQSTGKGSQRVRDERIKEH